MRKEKAVSRPKHEITLQSHTSDRGNLHVGEIGKHIPFTVQRFYIITNVPQGEVRGAHAHKRTEQAAFCLQGSFRLLIDDGAKKEIRRVDTVSRGVHLRSRVWHTLSDFSKDSLVLVVASELYNEEDYIREYQDFLEYIK